MQFFKGHYGASGPSYTFAAPDEEQLAVGERIVVPRGKAKTEATVTITEVGVDEPTEFQASVMIRKAEPKADIAKDSPDEF